MRDPVHILLVGAGHAHVQVLEAFAKRLEPGIRLTLVTPAERTPYSGMLPGYLAGFYSERQMTIDAAGLARAAGAGFRLGKVVGLDLAKRSAQLIGGAELAYDLISLDIGSQPRRAETAAGIPVKPIDRFTETVDTILADARLRARDACVRLAVIGAGAAGVELAFALRRRLSDELDGRPFTISLVGAEPDILMERSTRTRRRLRKTLTNKGIALFLGSEVVTSDERGATLADGRHVAADALIWATGSSAASWLKTTGLTLDEAGFVRVDDHLRSLSHDSLFAAGDIAALPEPRPKAGVFAVREGPILAANLRRAARGKRLKTYRPQAKWLTLLSTADGRAVADKWGISLEGRWVFRWKDWNDRRFVQRFETLVEASSAARR
ncbi:MAG: FAD-dependent oxidoreductase [Pseudomonadota bacterium]|nr:FAD-dependent oxidoreductase [Pseudomonadota bacterium]